MNKPILDYKGGFVSITFQNNPKAVAVVKQLPSRRFLPDQKAWTIPLDQYTERSISVLKRQTGATLTKTLAEELDQLQSRLVRIRDVQEDKQGKATVFETDLPLYPYQKAVAEFMSVSKSCLNACFVGSGKTLTTLAALESLGAKKTLVIAPKSLVLQWAEAEGRKWLPDRTFIPLLGLKKERDKSFKALQEVIAQQITPPDAFTGSPQAFYLVTSYEIARAEKDRLSPILWDYIVADEAHRLANTATQTYKMMSGLKSSGRFALTATPIMNRAEDMFGIMNWIRPGCLGTKTDFMKRYCVLDYWGSVKFYRNLDELSTRCKPFIIKRTLQEVGLELPPLTVTKIPVELSTKEKELYNKIRSELLFEIEKIEISKIENPVSLQNTAVKLGKLFELGDSMELIGDSAESSKLDMLKEHIRQVMDTGQKAIIITRFERMARILQRELAEYTPQLITGAINDRQPILDVFTRSGKVLIGTEAIGQGLNLQAASVLYNYDLPWNPARLEQRIGRIHRQGQTRPAFVYNLVADTHVEKWLERKLADKKQLAERLVPSTITAGSLPLIKEMLQ